MRGQASYRDLSILGIIVLRFQAGGGSTSYNVSWKQNN